MNYSLVSGGVDSTIGYHLFAKDSTPVFINYCNYSAAELSYCKTLYKDKLKVIELSLKIDAYTNPFVPARNFTFCALVASLFEDVETINVFGLSDDVQVDKSEKAFKEFSRVLSKYSKRKIIVHSPTISYTKEELIKAASTEFNYSFILNNTYSCYKGDEHECLKCPACIRKHVCLYNIFGIKTIDDAQVRAYTTSNKKRQLQIKRYLNEKPKN